MTLKERFMQGVKRFGQEVGQEFRAKIKQGADELANALFTGQGYMPWPGDRPTIHQQAKQAIAVQKEVERIQAPKVEPVQSNGYFANQSPEQVRAAERSITSENVAIHQPPARVSEHQAVYVTPAEPASVRAAEQSIQPPSRDIDIGFGKLPQRADHNALYATPESHARTQSKDSQALER